MENLCTISKSNFIAKPDFHHKGLANKFKELFSQQKLKEWREFYWDNNETFGGIGVCHRLKNKTYSNSAGEGVHDDNRKTRGPNGNGPFEQFAFNKVSAHFGCAARSA